jgi:hypothetical protein
MMSSPSDRATSAIRSVPLWCAGEVSTTRVSKGRSASAIFWSSAATMTSRTFLHFRARSTTCWISGLPVSDARTLAGNRVEPNRAGMTTAAVKSRSSRVLRGQL